MTKRDGIIFVEADEVSEELPTLLHAVTDEGQSVKICRRGMPIAVIQPVPPVSDPLQVHPELKAVKIAEDAFAPADDEDWPEDCR